MPEIKPKFVIIRLDGTPKWSPEALAKYKIRTQYDIYVYDQNRVTHCCELQPSYELWRANEDVVMQDDATDADRDLAVDKVMDACSDDEDVIYRHCAGIDRILFGADKRVLFEADTVPADEAEYQDLLADALERARTNPGI